MSNSDIGWSNINFWQAKNMASITISLLRLWCAVLFLDKVETATLLLYHFMNQIDDLSTTKIRSRGASPSPT
jgi:hypothetical protein